MKRKGDVSIGVVITGVIFFFVILITVIYLAGPGQDGFKRLLTLLPSFNSTTQQNNPTIILGYNLAQDKPKWYDGLEWKEFYVYNDKTKQNDVLTTLDYNGQKITGDQVEYYFKSFYYDRKQDESIPLNQEIWKSLYVQRVDPFVPVSKDLMEQIIEVQPLIKSDLYRVDAATGQAKKVKITVKEAYQRFLNEEIPGDRLSAAINSLLDKNYECYFLSPKDSSLTGAKFENGNIEPAQNNLFEKYPELNKILQTATFTKSKQNIEYSYYLGSCPETIVAHSSDSTNEFDCAKVPAEAKMQLQSSAAQKGKVVANLLAKYAQESTGIPKTIWGKLEIDESGKINFYSYDSANSGLTQTGCRIADNPTEIYQTSQALKSLVDSIKNWRDSVFEHPMLFKYGDQKTEHYYCVQRFAAHAENNQVTQILAIDLSKEVNPNSVCK